MTNPPRRAFATLHQVERDGNPLRRHAHVSPFIGKLSPMDEGALQNIARAAEQGIEDSDSDFASILVIGMTESSLLLGWFVAQELARVRGDVDLCFTSRHRRAGTPGRTFREPHSHGPQHFLSLEYGRTYWQIVIVEDELTTGATLRNLLLAIGDVTSRVSVVTLADMRPTDVQRDLKNEMAANGINLQTVDLSEMTAEVTVVAKEHRVVCCDFNPFGRSEIARAQAQQEWQATRDEEIGAWYVIGECVDGALAARDGLPPDWRPPLNHVTRSPWCIDGRVIHTRHRFEGDLARDLSPYFVYNWQAPPIPRAVIWSESNTCGIALQVQTFLHEREIDARIIEVSAT